MKKSFLKWAGAKKSQAATISESFKAHDTLVEVFCGSASVFLNTEHKTAILNDKNPHLINLFRWVQRDVEAVLDFADGLFKPKNNTAEFYYNIRDRLNNTSDTTIDNAVYFLFMNKLGFNGLCRYSKNGFNVPYGKRVTMPSLPIEDMRYFHQRSQNAEFTCLDFEEAFSRLPKVASNVYLDPPYMISDTSKFTSYIGPFSKSDHERLVVLANKACADGHNVVISNADCEDSLALYSGHSIKRVMARRSISSRASSRGMIKELVVNFVK